MGEVCLGILLTEDSTVTQIPCKGSPEYTAHLLGIYMGVVATGLPNFRDAHLSLPSNLHFTGWNKLDRTHKDSKVVEFLKFGFLAGYEGPAPTPATTTTHLLTTTPPISLETLRLK